MLKEQKGITLVALIITIIVLLILAGVTISFAIGDGSIFNKSKNAVNTYKNAQDNEYGMINYFQDQVDTYLDDAADDDE